MTCFYKKKYRVWECLDMIVKIVNISGTYQNIIGKQNSFHFFCCCDKI